MKRLYIIILFAFIVFSAKVNAQIVNIPDVHFYKALLGAGVHDSAGYITVDTAKAFTGSLNVSNDTIHDLTGIQAFTAITYLDCSFNDLTGLDVSSNTALAYLNCASNNLTSLNVSSDTALAYLDCSFNNLTGLDLSSNTALALLDCEINSLTSLDVSSNIALGTLGCANNNLTSLNISSNTALANLFCGKNSLTSLDLSSDSALASLFCENNSLTSLNVKNGGNDSINSFNFNSSNNPQLICIEVDDTAYSDTTWIYKDSWAHFSTDCHYVGINEIAAIPDVTIYPNPVSAQLTIETGGKQEEDIKLFNVLGEMIYNQKPSSATVTIAMNALPTGVYFIQITDLNKNIVNKRIIKL